MKTDNQKKDTNVLLTVNTKKINPGNVNEAVSFSNEGDSKPGSGKPADFVSEVYRNMKITWYGKAEDAGDTIQILEITRKPSGGAEILDKTFKDPNNDGIVKGKIKDEDVPGDELYNVKFRINNDPNKEFTVDPKLRMLSTD